MFMRSFKCIVFRSLTLRRANSTENQNENRMEIYQNRRNPAGNPSNLEIYGNRRTKFCARSPKKRTPEQMDEIHHHENFKAFVTKETRWNICSFSNLLSLMCVYLVIVRPGTQSMGTILEFKGEFLDQHSLPVSPLNGPLFVDLEPRVQLCTNHCNLVVEGIVGPQQLHL